MKKCPKCGRSYSDDVMRCSECTLFLISDRVSDLKISSPQQTQSSAPQRTRIVREGGGDVVRNRTGNAAGSSGLSGDSLSDSNIVGGSYGADTGSQNGGGGGRGAGGRGVSPLSGIERFIHRIRPYSHYIFGGILILVALGLIIGYWDVIKPVITCIGTGAVIGAVLLTWLSVRRGHFNPRSMTAGAVAGAILACVFRYNILGIATETASIVMGAIPSLIMIFGILLLFRSIR